MLFDERGSGPAPSARADVEKLAHCNPTRWRWFSIVHARTARGCDCWPRLAVGRASGHAEEGSESAGARPACRAASPLSVKETISGCTALLGHGHKCRSHDCCT
jgi:hypothetical protein